MSQRPPSLFVCFEPDQEICIERLGAWPHTNADRAAYNDRLRHAVASAAADPIKARLREQIFAADVTVCVISQTAFLNDWIAWELETAKSKPNRNGLVGIMLSDLHPQPPAMHHAGTMFVPFKRDAVEAAIEWAIANPPTDQDFTLED